MPPLIFLVALLVAFGLNWLIPITLPIRTPFRWAAGVIGLEAVAFMLWGRGAFTRAGTNVNPMQPALKLVTAGPYRFSRNPMYVGMFVANVCLALATCVGWLLILLVPVAALLHWGVVLREEPYLATKFGADYEAYRKRVRRYL